MKSTVECYSGRKADERPVRFWLGGRPYQVELVLDQWYDAESISYKVRADDGNLYVLRQQTSMPNGTWEGPGFISANKGGGLTHRKPRPPVYGPQRGPLNMSYSTATFVPSVTGSTDALCARLASLGLP